MSSRITCAPKPRATSALPSVDALSTTITWSTNLGMRVRTCRSPASSFKQGMMTVMVRSLYTGPRVAFLARLVLLVVTLLGAQQAVDDGFDRLGHLQVEIAIVEV